MYVDPDLGACAGRHSEQIMLVNNTRVNLRSSPTASAVILLSTVSENTRVTIVARQGTWCQVRLPDGRKGGFQPGYSRPLANPRQSFQAKS
jgi:uncharacterized protein YgiM (DUF1202 family)